MFTHTSEVIQNSDEYLHPFSKRAVLGLGITVLDKAQKFLCLSLSGFLHHFVFNREQKDAIGGF